MSLSRSAVLKSKSPNSSSSEVRPSSLDRLGMTVNAVGECVDRIQGGKIDADNLTVLKTSVSALETLAICISQERKIILFVLDRVTSRLESFNGGRGWTDEDRELLEKARRFVSTALHQGRVMTLGEVTNA